ncbi:MAG: glycosyltransferase family 39 protein [Patescibacteria group bacterium]
MDTSPLNGSKYFTPLPESYDGKTVVDEWVSIPKGHNNQSYEGEPMVTGFKRGLVLVTALGVLLRVIAVVSNGRFWFDEIITVAIARKPLHEMWAYLAVENHPPLHYYLVHGWIALFGPGEVAVKLSSVLAGAAGIVVTGIFARRLFGVRTGLIAAGLTALSTFQIFFSSEVRMYAWLYLFGVVSLMSFWEIIRSSSWKWHVVWMVSTIAALYTHLGGVFVLVVEVAFSVAYSLYVRAQARKGMRNKYQMPSVPLRTVVFMMVVVCLAWLPWIIVFVREKMQTFNRNAWYFWIEPANPFPMEALRQFFFFDNYSDFIELCGWIFIVTVFTIALLSIRRTNERKYTVQFSMDLPTIYAMVIFIFPVFIGFFTNVLVVKVYIIAGAGAYLLASKGLSRIHVPKSFPPFLFPLMLIVFFIASDMGVLLEVRPAWKNVGGYLETNERQADAIVILSHSYEVALRYYYHGTMPVLPFYPLPDDTHGDTLLRAVRRNWYTILTKENVGMLNNLVEGRKRIFVVLVGNFNKVERIAPEWFFSHGWQLRSVERWEDYMVNPEVMLLEKL